MKKFVALSLLLASTAACGVALAEDLQYPKQTFDATYDMTTPSGKSTMRMASDGKGHMRTETKTAAGKVISVTDFPARTVTTAMEAQKMIMKNKIPQTSHNNVYDDSWAKRTGAKSLGAKTVDGHPCHGFESTNNGVTMQTWIGDDTHYMVHSECKLPNGLQVTALKSWSNTAPTDIVSLPQGYKEMKMPGM
jgi:hypothetical protein